jgi:hypothetical protein
MGKADLFVAGRDEVHFMSIRRVWITWAEKSKPAATADDSSSPS